MFDRSKKNPSKQNKIKKIIAFIELFLILMVIIFIPLIIYGTHPEIRQIFQSADALDQLLLRHEKLSILIYIGIQIAQVVITVLPGQVIQAAGGYAFGIPLTMLLTMIGIILGSTASFWIARLAGQKPMRVLFGDERIDKYCTLLNSQNGQRLIILLYIFPGIPKDFVTYAAGLADIRFASFIIVSSIARFPAICGSILTGAFLRSRNYTGLIILWIIIIITIVFLLVFYHKHGKRMLEEKIDNKTVMKKHQDSGIQ